ncbi:MAG: hypothetical protein IJZ35_00290 [Clostridia bacterium]|nr:hypothetical protein [Clostridia bacterium]
MNKKKITAIIVIIFFVALSAVIGFMLIDRPAFTDIQKDEISSVSYHIYYYENNEPVYLPLPEENLDELLELMQNIRIRGLGTDESGKYVGEIPFMFVVQMKDGKQIEFAASNPHMKINGKYYSTEYEPADALAEFWREKAIEGRKEYGLDN